MREVVVNDTNILIDMHSAGLLDYLCLSQVRFHTVDLVIEELRRSPYKRPLIEKLIQEGSLYVADIPAEEMSNISAAHSAYSRHTNLSFVDCAVMAYAKKHNFRLLTGDKKLRNHAVDEGIIVSGILWIVDLFVEERLVTPAEMIEKLNNLLNTNNRLPRKLIEAKIQQLIALSPV